MVRAHLTNPLEEDPVLKDLLKKLDRIETRRGFARWKKHFLKQFEAHLEGPSISKAGAKYHGFAKRLDRMVLLLKVLERLMSEGNLTHDKVTVKSRQSLSELQKQLTGMILHTQQLVPGTLEQENQAGYTKFDMGAVLVRDGFVEYDRLCLCRDVLWHMRDALLNEIADRQLLEEMGRYESHLDAFCDIMGNDLGLHGAMLKCRDILRAEDDEFLKYESTTPRPATQTFESEYDDDEEWSSDEEDESESETESEEEEEDDYDDDDEEEEEEEDESSYESVVEICGMEIPLRMSKYNPNKEDPSWSDDVSEISDDEAFRWTLQVPAPPKPKTKKTLGAVPALPTISLQAEADDDNDDDDNDDNPDDLDEEEEDIPNDDDDDDEEEDHDDDDDDESSSSSSSSSSSESEEEEAPPTRQRQPGGRTPQDVKARQVHLPDNPKTNKLGWTHRDYYHGDPNSWKNVGKQAKEQQKQKQRKREDSDDDDDGNNNNKNNNDDDDLDSSPRRSSSRTKKKIIAKVKIRNKGDRSLDGNDLDLQGVRGVKVIRRKNSSRRITSSDDDDDNKSLTSTKSGRSELDDVGHRRRRSRSRDRSKKGKSSSAANKSTSSSGKNSVDLRAMAKEATKRRKQRERREEMGSANDSDHNSSFGSKSSAGSRRSRGSRAKKDPLHNLLFKKKSAATGNGNNEEKERQSSMTSEASALTTEDLNGSEQHDPSASRTKPTTTTTTTSMDPKTWDAETKERASLCYSWYNRLGGPKKETFRKRIASGGMDGLEPDDVDLLPWMHGGARLNVVSATRLFS